jgi:DNA-binding NarL/FixJ family response regulator
MTSLLIADDDNLVRSMLTSQLGGEFEVVAGAADAEEAIAAAVEHQPNVALVDVQMPGGGGLHATREITKRCPDTAVVALSADESQEVVLEMLNAGAMAYVLKSASRMEIVEKIEQSVEAFRRLRSSQQPS